MGFFDFFRRKKTDKNKGVAATADINAKKAPQDPLDREIETIFNLLVEEWGADQIVIKAGKLDAMALLRSEKRGERVLAMERLVEADPTIDHVPSDKEIPEILTILSEHIADQIARRTMEDKIEQQIEKKLEPQRLCKGFAQAGAGRGKGRTGVSSGRKKAGKAGGSGKNISYPVSA